MRAGHENNDHCFWQNDLTKNGGFPFQFEMQGLAEGLIVTVNNKKLFFSDGRSPTAILDTHSIVAIIITVGPRRNQ